jgi:lysophospholipase L1-like esterase
MRHRTFWREFFSAAESTRPQSALTHNRRIFTVRAAFLLFLVFSFLPQQALAQTLTAANVQINWAVDNRFRLFSDAADFKAQESAWKQYLIHVDHQPIGDDAKQALIANSSVTGTEHVLNDRYIPFTRLLRSRYDWKGWASQVVGKTCWDAKTRMHAACGSVDDYVTPKSHKVRLWLTAIDRALPIAEYNCDWRVGGGTAVTAPCDEAVVLEVPWPTGAEVSVGVEGESGISTDVAVKDLLIVGLGDSFASGEGNPDGPVAFSEIARNRNVYPRRARNDGGGDAQWLDEACHRSLYGHQLRAALQIAIEHPQAAVTFLGYACSGAAVDAGILGPQEHVEYVSRPSPSGGPGTISVTKGSWKDMQLRWLLRDLCRDKPDTQGGLWVCPGQNYRRKVDFVFLSVGGNDIGFSSLVGWATLRGGASAKLAKFFGATVSPGQFASNMKDTLPAAYARLAKALETAVPLANGDLPFDASRVILTAYPDILEDEKGQVCPAGAEGDAEDSYAANQSLDYFSSWLVVTPKRLAMAHDQLQGLQQRMEELAGDHGWSFAARAYGDRPFRGHGFCARSAMAGDDPAEQLIMPCAGKASSPTATCTQSWSGKQRDWRPYNPATQNFPYALRQRWVRSFNDAYMVINQKVLTPEGRIDEQASQSVFSETTGAMHPSAEGHAAMADAILLDIRPEVAKALGESPGAN